MSSYSILECTSSKVSSITNSPFSIDFEIASKPLFNCSSSLEFKIPIDSNIIACAKDACTSYLAICRSISLSLPTVNCSIFLSIVKPFSQSFIIPDLIFLYRYLYLLQFLTNKYTRLLYENVCYHLDLISVTDSLIQLDRIR